MSGFELFNLPKKVEVPGTIQIDPKTALQLSTKEGALNFPRASDRFGMPMSTSVGADRSTAELKTLGENYNPYLSEDYMQYKLYENQSNLEVIGRSLYQTAAQLVGGTIEGTGYLLGIPAFAKFMVTGEGSFSNTLADIGNAISESSRENAPIYQSPIGPKFDMSSLAWWGKNFPSISSSLALMYPAAFATRGVFEGLKLLGLFKGAASGGELLAASSIVQAMFSRQAESIMEGRQSYDEALKRYMQKGLTYNEAHKLAVSEFRHTYWNNWPLVLQDIPQYLLVNKLGLGGVTAGLTKGSMSKAAEKAAGKAAADATEKAIVNETWRVARSLGYDFRPQLQKKAFAVVRDMMGEGFEEGYQFVVQKRSDVIADGKVGLGKPGTIWEDIGESLRDGDFWTSAFWGAAGAGMMLGVASQHTLREDQKRIEQINQSLDVWGSIFSDSYKLYQEAINSGDQLNIEHAFNNMMSEIAINAAVTGNTEHAKRMINALATEPDDPFLDEAGVPDNMRGGNFFSKNKDMRKKALDIIDKAQRDYGAAISEINRVSKKNRKKFKEASEKKGFKNTEELKNYLAIKLARNTVRLRLNQESLNSANAEAENIQDLISNYEELAKTPEEKAALEKNIRYKQVKKLQAFYEKMLEDGALTEEEKGEIDLEIAKLEREGIYHEFNGAVPYVPEELERAAGVKARQFIIGNIVEDLQNRINKAKTGEILDDIISGKENEVEKEEEEPPKVGSVVSFTDDKGRRHTGTVDDVIDMNKKEDEISDKFDEDIQQAIDDGRLDENKARIEQTVRNLAQMRGNYLLKVNVHDDTGSPSGTIVDVAYKDSIILQEPGEAGTNDSIGAGDKELAVDSAESPMVGIVDPDTEEGGELAAGSTKFRSDNPASFLNYYGSNEAGIETIYNQRLASYLNKIKKNDARNARIEAQFRIELSSDGHMKEDWAAVEELARKLGISDIVKKVRNGEVLTPDEANKLLKPINKEGKEDEYGFKTIVDLIPIFADLNIKKPGQKKGTQFKGGISVKKSKLNQKYIDRKSSEDSESYRERVRAMMMQTRSLRTTILRYLLVGEKTFSTNLRITSGRINTKNKKEGIVDYNERLADIYKVFKINKGSGTTKSDFATGKVQLAIARYSRLYGGTLYTDRSSRVPESEGYKSIGSIYLLTTDTMNGDRRSVKLNRRKLSAKHSRAVLEAFRIMAIAATGKGDINKGYYAKFKNLPKIDENGNLVMKNGKIVYEKRTDIQGVTVGQLIDILIEWGGRRTDPDNPESLRNMVGISEADLGQIRDARIYVEKDAFGRWVLRYGRDIQNNSEAFSIPLEVNLNNPNSAQTKEYLSKVEHFAQWAMTHKVYSNLLESARLGSKLNEAWKLKFNILDLSHDGKKTYAEFLIDNGLIGTDSEISNETGKVFFMPSVQLDIDKPNVTIGAPEAGIEKSTVGLEIGNASPNSKALMNTAEQVFLEYFPEYKELAKVFALMYAGVPVKSIPQELINSIISIANEYINVTNNGTSEIIDSINRALLQLAAKAELESKIGNMDNADMMNTIAGMFGFIRNNIATEDYSKLQTDNEREEFVTTLMNTYLKEGKTIEEGMKGPTKAEANTFHQQYIISQQILEKEAEAAKKSLRAQSTDEDAIKSIIAFLEMGGMFVDRKTANYTDGNLNLTFITDTVENDPNNKVSISLPVNRIVVEDGIRYDLSYKELIDAFYIQLLSNKGYNPEKVIPEAIQKNNEAPTNEAEDTENSSEPKTLDDELKDIQDSISIDNVANNTNPIVPNDTGENDDEKPVASTVDSNGTSSTRDTLIREIEKETAWVRKRIGIDDIYLVDRLEQLTRNGRDNWGLYSHSAIVIYEAAAEGTVYHEAFHRVDLGYLLPSERKELYRNARREMHDRSASDSKVREWLADRFAEYMLGGKGKRNFIQSIFDAIYNFIHKIFVGPYRLQNGEIDKLFNDIARGRFNASKILDVNRGTSYDVLDNTDPDAVIIASAIGSKLNSALYSMVVHDLASSLLVVNDYIEYTDVTELDYEKLFTSMEQVIVNAKAGSTRLRKLLENKDLTDKEIEKINSLIYQSDTTRQIYEELLGPKDEEGNRVISPILKMEVEDELIKMGYNVIQEDDYDYNEPGIDLGTSEEKVQAYKTELEVPKNSTATALTRMIISTIPLRASDRTEYQRMLGLKAFVDESFLWANLMADLAEVESVEEMLYRLRFAAKYNDKYYYDELADRIERYPSHVKYQILATVRNHHYKYISFRTDALASTSDLFITTNRQFKYKTLAQWNEELMFDNNIFHTDKRGKRRVNTTFINDITRRLEKINKLYKDGYYDTNFMSKDEKHINTNKKSFNDLMRELAALLNDLHIGMEWTDVKRYILNDAKDTYYGSISASIGNFIISIDSNILTQLDRLQTESIVGMSSFFARNNLVNELAELYAENHPELHPSTLNGPSDSGIPTLYYVHGENTHASTVTRKLKKSAEFLNDMLAVPYNQNSIILNKLLTDSTGEFKDAVFNLYTFLDFSVSNRDRKKYNAIFTVEDTIMRMTAIMRGFMPLHVMADRSKYFFMRIGNKPYIQAAIKPAKTKKTGEIVTETEVIDKRSPSKMTLDNVKFNKEVIDIFYAYFLDEKNRIIAEKKLIDAYNNEKDPKQKALLRSKLILNYHYTGYYNTSKANALKFIDFKVFNDKKTYPDIEKISESDARSAIEEGLRAALKTELESLVDKGMIFYSGKEGSYTNNRLPLKLLDTKLNYYYPSAATPQENSVMELVSTVMVNNMIGLFEAQKIYSGDPAYYLMDEKGNVETDMYKRTFGIGSSGMDMAEHLDYEEHGKDGKDVLKPTYRSVIAKTQTFKSIWYEPMVEFYVEDYKKRSGYYDLEEDPTAQRAIEEKAKSYATLALKPYTKVDPTDGQLLITPEMFRSIYRRLGKFDDNTERAYNILMGLEKGDVAEAAGIIMRPIKTVYFGNHLEDGRNHIVYDKMAMATLFPALIPKDSALEEIYNWMSHNDVQVMRFDSAIKVGAQESRPIYKDGQTRSELADFEGWPVYTQYFRNLRYQVEVTEHEQIRSLISSQVPKVIMSDIDDNKKYNGKKGSTVLHNIVQYRKGLIEAGAAELEARLGIKDGRIDKGKFLARLREEAKKSGRGRMFLNSIRIDENGREYLALDAFPDKMWFYSRINSMIKRSVIDLVLPSKQFVQVSDYGHGKLNPKKEYDGELDFMTSEGENKIVYKMQARVSASMFEKIIPGFSQLSKKEQMRLIKNKVTLIGFRVPTQGKSSIVVIEIAEILDKRAGDIIQLPLEFTALTGSDFDIDKLFVIRKNYDYDRRGNFLSEVNYSDKLKDDKLYRNKVVENFLVRRGLFDDEFVERIEKIAFAANKERKLKPLERLFNNLVSLGRKFDMFTTASNEQLINRINEVNARIEDLRAKEYGEDSVSLVNAIKNNKEIYELVKNYEIDNGIIEDFETFKTLPIRSKLTRKALENKFVDSLLDVMTAPETFSEAAVPLGYTTNKLKAKAQRFRDIARTIDSRPLNTFESKTVMYQSTIKTKYVGAKSGTATVVLYKAHHAIAQVVNLRMATTLHIGKYDNLTGTVSLSEIKGVDNEYISQWFSGLIDAHVDATKDPYIADLNVNESVYRQLLYLLEIGNGEKSFDFILEPIIRDYSTLYYNNIGDFKTTLEDSTNYTLSRDAINKIAEKWLNRLLKAGGGEFKTLKDFMDVAANRYVPNELLQSVSIDDNIDYYENNAGKNNVDYIRKQLQLLDLFSKIDRDAEKLNNLVVQSRIDVAGYGMNPAMYTRFKHSMTNLLNSGTFINAEKIFDPTLVDREDDLFYFTSMVANGISRIVPSLSNVSLLSSKAFERLFLQIAASISNNGQQLRERDIININNAFYSFLYADWFLELGRTVFDDGKMNMATLISYIFDVNSGRSIFQDIAEIKDSTKSKFPRWLKESTLINNIYVDYISNERYANIPVNSKIMVKSIVNNTTEEFMAYDWERAMNDEDPNVREFAAKLLIYNFFTSGNRILKGSLTRFIAPSILHSLTINGKELSFNNYVLNILSRMQTQDYLTELFPTFRKQLAQNLAADDVHGNTSNKVVPTINSKYFVKSYRVDANKTRPDYIVTNILPSDKKVALGLNETLKQAFTPYANITFSDDMGTFKELVEYVGYSPSEGKQVWRIINTKGFATIPYSIHEYGQDNDLSAFTRVVDRDSLRTIPREEVVNDAKNFVPDLVEVLPKDSFGTYASLTKYYYEQYNNIYDSVMADYEKDPANVINKTTTSNTEHTIVEEVVGNPENEIAKTALNTADSFNIPRRGSTSNKSVLVKSASAYHNVSGITENDRKEFIIAMENGVFGTAGYVEKAKGSKGEYIIAEWKNVKSSDMTMYFTYRDVETEEEFFAEGTRKKGLVRNNNLLRTIKFALTHAKPVFIITTPENVDKVNEFVNAIALRSPKVRSVLSRVVNVVSDPNVMAEIVNRASAKSINMIGDTGKVSSRFSKANTYTRTFLMDFYKSVYNVNKRDESYPKSDAKGEQQVTPIPTDGSERSFSSKGSPLNIYYYKEGNKYSASVYHMRAPIANTTNYITELANELPSGVEIADIGLLESLYGLRQIVREFAGSAEHLKIHVEDTRLLNLMGLHSYSEGEIYERLDEAIDTSNMPIISSFVDDIVNLFKQIESYGGSVALRFTPSDIDHTMDDIEKKYPKYIMDQETGSYEYADLTVDAAAQTDNYTAVRNNNQYNEIRKFVNNNVSDRLSGLVELSEFTKDEEEEGKDINKKCD